jgi:hypothetical protein
MRQSDDRYREEWISLFWQLYGEDMYDDKLSYCDM